MTLTVKLSILEERFLTSYFQFELLVGDFISRDEKIELFCSLAKIYLIGEARRAELFDLCSTANVCAIECESDYNLHKRLCELKRFNGQASDADEGYIIDIKGRAITLLSQNGYNSVLDATKPATFSFLVNSSQGGSIASMRILGTLQLLGIFADKDERAGKSLIRRASRWNDADSILTMLCYEPKNRAEYISMLYSVSDGTPFEALFECARTFYGFERVPKHKEVDLVERAIGLGFVKAGVYSPQVVRIAYSNTLSHSDKVKLVLNNQNLIGETNDLPLALCNEPLNVYYGASAMLNRPQERESVIQGIAYSERARALSACFVSNDDFVINDYIRAIEDSFEDANIIKINSLELEHNDFTPDKSHILVRSLVEDKRNIVILVLRDGTDSAVAEQLSRFLKVSSRRAFHLMRPSVCLDLSLVLPVCICDSNMLRYVRSLCDVSHLAPISRDEASLILDALLVEKASEYKIDSISIDDDAREAIISRFRSFDESAMVLDKIIYSLKGTGERIKIRLHSVEGFIDSRSGKVGF